VKTKHSNRPLTNNPELIERQPALTKKLKEKLAYASYSESKANNIFYNPDFGSQP
jgi:spermidine/putrescine-binding protein